MQILPMASVEDIDVGKYVLHWNNHFTSLQVWGDGSYMWRPTLRRHVGKIGRWTPTILRQGTRVFKLACGAADGSYAAMGNAGVAPPLKALDVQGGADLSSWTSISRVDPVEWLQICHARARTLERKRAAPVSVKIHEVPDEEDLVSKGFSREQAARYRAALTEAIARRRFMQLWSVSMPPMIWQTFGSDQEPAVGIRIPLPPLDKSIPILPATAKEVSSSEHLPEFSWLKTCNFHPRDAAVRFEEEGHKYYVHGQQMDCSVTSLIAKFSQD